MVMTYISNQSQIMDREKGLVMRNAETRLEQGE